MESYRANYFILIITMLYSHKTDDWISYRSTQINEQQIDWTATAINKYISSRVEVDTEYDKNIRKKLRLNLEFAKEYVLHY